MLEFSDKSVSAEAHSTPVEMDENHALKPTVKPVAEPQPVEEPKPMTQEEMDDAEYGDLHVWYHALMNDLADKVFVDGNPGEIDYPTLMEVFCKMHKASPLGSTMREVLDDHLEDMIDTFMYSMFGQGD